MISNISIYEIVATDFDHWVKDPHWSWYGTPLWKCDAILLTVTELTKFAWPTKSSLVGVHALISSVYLTKEEYVMWKLKGYDIDGKVNQLRKGIVYVNG